MDSNIYHTRHMHHALRLAARGLGRTWPNPSVGAVVVKDGIVLGAAHTAPSGRPHAEPQALAMAGDAARGATLYVSLEPCAHHGKTPPCAEAIIRANVAEAIIACPDPDPRVAGRGVAMLKEAGIRVTENVLRAEAETLNAGFFRRVREGLPLVTVKLATSADGQMIPPPAHGRWITGETARAHTHMLRARHDAILTGIGTALADNPRLTCRLPGLEDRSPLRVVMDTHLRLPADALLLPAWGLTNENVAASLYEKRLTIPEAVPGKLCLRTALQALAQEGITRLMVEAGPTLTQEFLDSGLASEVYWYRAPVAFGAGTPMLPLPGWRILEERPLGKDTLTVYGL